MSELDYRLGEWTVRPRRNCIERGDRVVRVKPKSMAVLGCLAEAGGEVVTREALFETVWPGGVVADATLTQCITELRHALGDSAKEHEFIETIPKVGFRLVQATRPLEEQGEPAPGNHEGPASAVPPVSRRRPGLRQTLGALALLVGLIFVLQVAIQPHSRVPPEETGPQTLAVLPFEDLSPDGDQAWLADGLTEELISRLSQVEGLLVTGRTSSFNLRDTDASPEEIAQSLGVANLLNGTVRKIGDQLRVTVQLIDPATGFNLYSYVFDRPEADLFAVQDEIAEAVLTALSIKLRVGQLGTLPGGTSSVEAYKLNRQAWDMFVETTPASFLKSVDLMKKSVVIDPQCAVCWFQLAQVYAIGPGFFGPKLPPLDWTELANEALSEARLLQPDMPGLLIVEMDIEAGDFNWIEAEKIMRRATDEALADPDWLFTTSTIKSKVGHLQQARDLIRQARIIEPLAWLPAIQTCHVKHMAGELDAALSECGRAWTLTKMNPGLVSSETMTVALSARRDDEIEEWLSRLIEHTEVGARPFLSAIETTLDDSAAALDMLWQSFEQKEGSDYWIAVWAAYHGDDELALAAVERSREHWPMWTPLMERARQTPKFKQLVRDWNMVDYWREYGWTEFCAPLGEDDFYCR